MHDMGTPVTLIPGDGIGPSISSATVRILEAAGADIEWDVQVRRHGRRRAVRRPDSRRDARLHQAHALALKGPLETPVGEGFRSINVALRKTFDLYANVRPAHTIVQGGRYEDIDLVLVRENTEGLYVGIEHYIKIGSDPRAAAESIAIITRAGSERIVRYAFDYAVKHGRKKVTLVHKANILKFSQGLFLDVGRQVAREYAGIEFEEVIVDAMAMNLVLHPERFDVIVTTNLFGDILSDQISGPRRRARAGARRATSASAARSSRPCTARRPTSRARESPTRARSSSPACMMLEYMNDGERAARIRTALESTIREGKVVTRDLGGTASTDEFTDAIIARL